MIDVDVCTEPDASVTSSVSAVGLGETVGKALALTLCGLSSSGEYVLVPSSVDTSRPGVAVMDALKVYGAVVGISVARGKLGSVVPRVRDAVDRNAETFVACSVRFVLLLRGYRPIIGGSSVSMPKLNAE